MIQFRKLFTWRRNVASYSRIQARFYKSGTSDHLEHNENKDYWGVLLENIDDAQFKGARALDFACGKGRNVRNLLSLAQ